MTILIGADPEFFIRRGLHWVSGHIFECGTKRNPRKTEHGFIQVDGTALECNVKPSATSEEFVTNVNGVLNDLRAFVRSVDSSATVVARPSIFFGERFLATLPAEATRLGCEPDFNAYTGRHNPRPERHSPFRTGSGHIHIGWTQDEDCRTRNYVQHCQMVARQLDYFLGLPSLLWDKDQRRRNLYGQAGAFRPKPYGIEYRVLSNAWVGHDRLTEWIFNRAVAAVTSLQTGLQMDEVFSGAAQKFLNENDTDWPNKAPALAETVLV